MDVLPYPSFQLGFKIICCLRFFYVFWYHIVQLKYFAHAYCDLGHAYWDLGHAYCDLAHAYCDLAHAYSSIYYIPTWISVMRIWHIRIFSSLKKRMSQGPVIMLIL